MTAGPKDRPTLSVLLPCYNAGAYLAEALDSLFAQTRPADEIVALDDGSTDGTAEVLDAYAARHPALRIVRDGKNLGIVARLNQGLDLATGGFIARMDADDVCEPERFERQLAAMASDPDLVLLGTRVLIVDPEGAPLYAPDLPLGHEELDAALLAGGKQLVFHPSVMMRADALRAVGGYSDEYPYVEDLDLFLRLGEAGRIGQLGDVLLRYRHHFASTGYTKAETQAAAVAACLGDARARRGAAPGEGGAPPPLNLAVRSRGQTHRKWAWWALGDGHVASARKHAFRALRAEPFAPDNVKLLACALRGH